MISRARGPDRRRRTGASPRAVDPPVLGLSANSAPKSRGRAPRRAARRRHHLATAPHRRGRCAGDQLGDLGDPTRAALVARRQRLDHGSCRPPRRRPPARRDGRSGGSSASSSRAWSRPTSGTPPRGPAIGKPLARLVERVLGWAPRRRRPRPCGWRAPRRVGHHERVERHQLGRRRRSSDGRHCLGILREHHRAISANRDRLERLAARQVEGVTDRGTITQESRPWRHPTQANAIGIAARAAAAAKRIYGDGTVTVCSAVPAGSRWREIRAGRASASTADSNTRSR